MTATKASVEFKVGREAGKSLLDAIARAKRRLIVVSPWLSAATTELVTRKQQKEGVKVEITTTNDPSPNHQRALIKLVEVGRRTVGNRKPTVQAGGMVLAFAGVLTFLANLFGPNSFLVAAGLAGAGAVLFQLGRPRVERYCKLKIERLRVYDAVAGPLVHAKVYVIDDEAVVGSTNFTVTGLRHNVEGLAFLNGKGLADCIALKIASLNGEGIEIPFERAIKAITG